MGNATLDYTKTTNDAMNDDIPECMVRAKWYMYRLKEYKMR